MADGLFLRGGFLSLEAGRPYTAKSGEERTPGRLKVLVGSGTMTVEYRSVEAAREALAGWGVTVPEKLMAVEVAVYASGPWDAAQNRRGRVFLQGREARDVDLAAG